MNASFSNNDSMTCLVPPWSSNCNSIVVSSLMDMVAWLTLDKASLSSSSNDTANIPFDGVEAP